MSQTDPKIEELEKRLDELVRTQIGFQTEVNYIRAQIQRMRMDAAKSTQPLQPQVRPTPQTPPPPKAPELGEKWSTAQKPNYVPPQQSAPPSSPTQELKPPSFGASYEKPKPQASPPQFGDTFSNYVNARTEDARGNLEKFIGENLISKIGIVILILGVGIFAKYAIDSGWITPVMRVVFGYAIGLGLLGVAMRLRDKYRDFSAVLLSGGMAIFYFITYFAYAYYGLMPQMLAFVLMVLFTAFTVVAAVVYNRQVIAHIGLVGAYAVPFLLSTDSGAYAVLFSYMSIVNAGVLAISVVKAWRSIFYTSSFFTWVIFAAWFVDKYRFEQHFSLALVFLAIFFAIFFLTTLAHGIVHKKEESREGVIAAAITAIIFYVFCLGLGDVETTTANYAFYFSFIAAFSLAILISSFRFYGRMLVFVAYPFAWLNFAAWFLNRYQQDQHFILAAVFISIFFAIFYGTTLYFRLKSDEVTTAESAGMILTNSFIFYGFGFALLHSRENLRQFEGLFTVTHAAFHFVVAQLIGRLTRDKSDLVQTLTVLIVTFATIAVPVQFNGYHITMIWSVEAAMLYYFGRAGGTKFFEYLAYPMMALAGLALVGGWGDVAAVRFGETVALPRPFANADFFTGLLFVAAFSFIFFVDRRQKDEPAIGAELGSVVRFGVASAAIFVLYNTLRIEIGNYFDLLAYNRGDPRTSTNLSYELGRFNALAQINFTTFFLSVMAWVNIRKGRSTVAAGINILLGIITIIGTLTVGMFLLYSLRISFIDGEALGLFGTAWSNIAARYVTYIFLAGLLTFLYAYCKDDLLDSVATQRFRRIAFDALLYPTILIVASCELMNIAAQLGVLDAEKFGLSILWVVFALAVIIIGIKWAKRYLRIAAIALVGITLLKLFFYDATDLPTIPKTILFVSLGLLLLGISFLYNKFKNVIFVSVGSEEDVDRPGVSK